MIPEKFQLYKFQLKAPDLTIEQAQRIDEFEESQLTYSIKYSLSTWEELDYELSTLSDILNSDQMKVYRQIYIEAVKRHEQELIDNDSKKINEIAYYEEYVRFIENKVLPDLYADPFLLSLRWLESDLSKVNFLKSEYKVFLTDQKLEMLSNHFRNSRTFQPNQLKISWIKYRILHLLPDYTSFEDSMDQPTRTLAEYLSLKVKSFPESTETLIETKLLDLKTFVKINHDKYLKNAGGWHITLAEPTEQEKRQYLVMTMLLLDRQKYGC